MYKQLSRGRDYTQLDSVVGQVDKGGAGNRNVIGDGFGYQQQVQFSASTGRVGGRRAGVSTEGMRSSSLQGCIRGVPRQASPEPGEIEPDSVGIPSTAPSDFPHDDPRTRPAPG